MVVRGAHDRSAGRAATFPKAAFNTSRTPVSSASSDPTASFSLDLLFTSRTLGLGPNPKNLPRLCGCRDRPPDRLTQAPGPRDKLRVGLGILARRYVENILQTGTDVAAERKRDRHHREVSSDRRDRPWDTRGNEIGKKRNRRGTHRSTAHDTKHQVHHS